MALEETSTDANILRKDPSRLSKEENMEAVAAIQSSDEYDDDMPLDDPEDEDAEPEWLL